jgi:8-oxo-dGTP pyrophosphatase MutT (NUDIX family)
MTDKEKGEFVLSEGRWGKNISWQFVASTEQPERKLCTAVCCITTFDNKLLLVRNKRGWECPAGKIKGDESLEQAASREVREETRALISRPQLFGYKKLTALEQVPRVDEPTLFYPFPNSYVVFFHADAITFSDEPLAKDIEEVRLAGYDEAKELLAAGRQYENVLEYLLQNKKISL